MVLVHLQKLATHMKKKSVKSKTTGKKGHSECKACSGTGKKKSKQDIAMNCRKCKGLGVKA